MIITSEGYDLKFVQRRRQTEHYHHPFTHIYRFYSPVTGLKYVINVDEHNEEFFALKFYPTNLKRSNYRYNIIIDRGDVINILVTCLKIIPLILEKMPSASFGFIASPTFDRASRTLEGVVNNQRFKIYSDLIKVKVGDTTFQHFEYSEISGYMLVNRSSGNVDIKEKAITSMLVNTYEVLSLTLG